VKETKAQKVERLKLEKNPWNAWDEVRQFAREVRGSVLPEWTGTYFKWWGVYTQGDGLGVTGGKGGEGVTSDYFMMRIGMPNGMLTAHQAHVIADLTAKYSYKSPMQVPRLLKITLNMGLSEAVADKKIIEHAVGDLTKIAGQKPVVTKARKAIAGFKIREGYPIGCMVTLRGAAMYEFLDRLITVALPRVRDFRGVSGRAFDGRGNYNIGVKEQIIFPEIEYDKIDALRGMNISITTTAKTDDEAKSLLAAFKFPFRN